MQCFAGNLNKYFFERCLRCIDPLNFILSDKSQELLVVTQIFKGKFHCLRISGNYFYFLFSMLVF